MQKNCTGQKNMYHMNLVSDEAAVETWRPEQPTAESGRCRDAHPPVALTTDGFNNPERIETQIYHHDEVSLRYPSSTSKYSTYTMRKKYVTKTARSRSRATSGDSGCRSDSAD